jgi:transposase-like protein
MARRIYTDEQRETALAVLATNGGNYAKTARETGVDVKTLRKWEKSDVANSPQIPALKKEYAESYREKLRLAREAALSRMLELLPRERDLHKVTGAAKVLSELTITQEVADDYSRSTADVSAASGAAVDTGQSPTPYRETN